MLNVGQQPCPEVLLAASKLFNLEIHVYHGMKLPVIFKFLKASDKSFIISLQCISLVHDNPIYRKKCVYQFQSVESDVLFCCLDSDVSGDDPEVNFSDGHHHDLKCTHRTIPLSGSVVEHKQNKFCCLVDTGAEVSVLSESVWKSGLERDPELMLQECQNKLSGFRKQKTNILGFVNLKLKLFSIQTDKDEALPFAVVKDKAIPCCLILGENFLSIKNIVLDCGNNVL